MILNEAAAKNLVLAPAGIGLLAGEICFTPAQAAQIVARLGRCVIKAQVPAGKRGKAGGIKLVSSEAEAEAAARAILNMRIGGFAVTSLLVEQCAAITHEYYAAILHDPGARATLVLFSAEGGMDIEELAETSPAAIRRFLVQKPGHFTLDDAKSMLTGLQVDQDSIAALLVTLYQRYRSADAELLEINPLALLADGRLVALDCKFILDDAASPRQPELAQAAASEEPTVLEQRGAALGLKFIELPGNIGILANGAGLTMTTMDVVQHLGGAPANFLEIGGDAYTKAEPALALVLSNPGIKSLVVNFCGAFARTDVMAKGVVDAWKVLKPDIPVFFSVHGTGETEAVSLIKEQFGVMPFDLMEDAVRAAIAVTHD